MGDADRDSGLLHLSMHSLTTLPWNRVGIWLWD